MPADKVDQVAGFLRQLDTDGPGAIEALVKSAQQNPHLWPAVQQRLAALVNVAQQQQAKVEPTQAEADPMPAPDMADGYSIEGLKKLNAWNQRQAKAEALAEMRKEFKPILDEHEQAKQKREQDALKADTDKWASNVFSKVQKLPHFNAFRSEITAEFTKRQPELGAQPTNGDVAALLYQVYAEVVTPNVGKAAQKSQLDELDKKARATTTSPNGTGRAVPVKKAVDLRAALRESLS